jgi:Na+/H+ antiporter NhaD/arsenite permease-like protein
MDTFILVLTALGFISIVLEDLTHINKAKTTLFFGSLVWLLYYIEHATTAGEVDVKLNENLLEIASLWLFLMSAMTFVAYLNNRGFIANLVMRLLPEKLSLRTLLFITANFAFIFSSLADNVTTTLVCISLLIPLKLDNKDMLRFMAVIVFGVNSGGVSLITGDVTTLMVFLAGKVTIGNLLMLIAPAYAALMILTFFMSKRMSGDLVIEKNQQPILMVDWVAGGQFLITILSILALNVLFHVPPLLTFLVSLGLLFLIMQFLNKDEDVMRNIRLIEFDTLLFFLGVLLMVGMLKELKVLDLLSGMYTHLPIPVANYALGVFSSLVDNVPLTAAVLHSGMEMPLSDWISLVYAVGVGGSLLVIGSAAGIIAMSKVEGLTFASYARYFKYLLVAYTIGFALAWGLGQLVHGVTGA